jgi:hypothetical protein
MFECPGPGHLAGRRVRAVPAVSTFAGRHAMAQIAGSTGFFDAQETRARGKRSRRCHRRDLAIARHNPSLTQSAGHGRIARDCLKSFGIFNVPAPMIRSKAIEKWPRMVGSA